VKNSNVSVGLVKIPVGDFERATAWYREGLGLEEQFAVPEYGWAQYATGNLPLCLYAEGMGGGAGTPGGDAGIHLAVSDPAALHARLAERGLSGLGELHTSDEGTTFFEVTDPEGNLLKVVGGA